ncbi:hypothetical protein SEPCBS119000_003727 [Sporothrix epigloea]|uniref:Uncharacterized protein n=1 Tax=Sporothrix epigloea TaxID=1892477 RepID=A0ABP0DRY5_9PEZI
MATPQPPRSQEPLDVLDQIIAGVLVHTGKAIRAQSKDGRVLGSLSATKFREANTAFNTTLDSMEMAIVNAKATIRRDLDIIRNRAKEAKETKETVGDVAGSTNEASQNGTALYQAPAAAMDMDVDEPTTQGASVKAEPMADASGRESNGNTISDLPTNATPMAPTPAMDLDPPVAHMSSIPSAAAPTMPPSSSTRPTAQASQVPQIQSPTVKRENLSRSPQKEKNGFTPTSTAGSSLINTAASEGTGAPVNKAPVQKGAVSSAVAKVPSSVIVESIAASNIDLPAIGKDPTPQLPTPMPATVAPAATVPATGGPGNAILLSSSTPSTPINLISPVLAKKVAVTADVTPLTPPPMSSTSSVTAPRAPASTAASAAPTPAVAAPGTATPAPPPAPALPSSGTSQAAPSNVNMENFFDLTSPTGTGNLNGAPFSSISMQSSGLPPPPEETSKNAGSLPPTTDPAQQHVAHAQHIDDSEFDVESFTADAVQNLLMDTSLPTASAVQMQQQESQHLPQQQSQCNEMIQPAAGATENDRSDTKDAADDIFGFMNDEMQGLADDPTTSFDDLYMGATDTIDIDDYFDTN